MDSRIGLDYIVENREYISKLGTALDTNNAVVKKQVFELLSALCAYNADGYARAIETLEFYKNLKKARYRFKIVINELEKATNVEYQVALLAFINCVIISASSLQDRIRIRNEFIGLKVLPLLNNLRKVAQSVGDIIVQLDVFDEQRECDEAQSLQGPNGINLNSHLDVFYAILRQVADTPQEVPFLSILQHLLRIDPKEPVSDVIWDTTEKLVHRATLLENHEDSVRLLRTSSVQKFACQHCRSSDATSPNRKASAVPNSLLSTSASSSIGQHNGPLSPVPPPPPPPTTTSSPNTMSNINSAVSSAPHIPVPPPIPGGVTNIPPPPPIPGTLPVPPPPRIPGAPPPAPPPPVPNNLLAKNSSHPARPITPEPNNHNVVLLPQQDTPAPKAKMKTLNWGKIPPNKVIGKQNIWAIVANNHQDSPMTDIDWNEMEGLFCLQSTSAQGSPKLGRDSNSSSGYDTLDRKSKKENTEITLLDGKRSLNVNIFLKQFRTSNEDIIQLIHNGEHDDIGSEKLRGLLKILPEVDELDMLKTFNGDKNRLGNAEKFLLQLLQIPNYKLRIESMLLKEEFAANVGYLDPCINAMIYAGDDLINNKMLQEVLYMVVIAGNFLNSGGYAGNAAGVKLSSLQKLTDIRANKPGMNLIHFVAMQAEKRNPELLKFTVQLNALENASKTTSEQINNEINTLDNRIRKIKRQIELPATDIDIKEQMLEFLESAEREVAVLQSGMKEVEAMRLKLSDFFCEDPAQFKLEECFKIFQSFCDKFKQAVKENDRRQQLEEQATIRRKQREEQLARRARQMNQCGTPVSDSENQFLLDPSFDPRASPALSRRRMGSFNSGVDITNGFIRMESSNDCISPDITPNGSLRRRRSRVLPEEDDLMEFLRTSGHEHNSRERKAYGSLDRSWARRARSGSSSRKRPELLNIDFGADRERASSPAPSTLHQDKQSPVISPTAGGTLTMQQANEDAKPRISREWRQKIETWLHSNENDEKQNEEYKRKRRLLNNSRRSLENDTESERKLDTLPEEKIVPTTLTTKTNNNNDNSANNSNTNIVDNNYKRVYPDWKPSRALEQTDVAGTIQAIADANNAREKPHWRKGSHTNSNNIENTTISDKPETETPSSNNLISADELREYRRQRSLENTAEKRSPPLQSIAEEDRRRSYIQKLGERNASDRLHIYIRRSSTVEADINELTNTKIPTSTTIEALKSPTISSDDIAATTHTIPLLSKTASNTKVNNTDSLKSPSLPLSKSSSSNFGIIEDEAAKTDDTFASLLSHHKSHNEKCSRKDIDADNIETPPVTRRVIASPNTTIVTINGTIKSGGCGDLNIKQKDESSKNSHNTNSSCNNIEQDTPGHFDRYSSTRRTRRYKRPTDYSSGNEEVVSSKESTEGNNNLRQSASANEMRKLQNNHNQNQTESFTTTTSRIEPAKDNESSSKRPSLSEKTITKLEKVGRHISSINQEDVQEAIRNLKSPTGTPERIWSPPRDILTQQHVNPLVTTNATTTANNNTTIIKVSNHELNDEGFEETQSLVSDTPSQGKDSTNSSCNEATELPLPTSQKSTAKNATNGAQKSSVITKQQPTISNRLADRLQISKLRSTLPHKSQTALQSYSQQSSTRRTPNITHVERTRSLRGSGQIVQGPCSSTAAAHMSNYTNNAAIRRANSMRKPPTQPTGSGEAPTSTQSLHTSPSHGSVPSRRDVERSGSRNSLRSSRSSINSAISTNTVRRMPIVVSGKATASTLHTASVDSSPSKRPLTTQNNTPYSRTPANANYHRATGTTGGGVPASRSSSSGSSIGQNIIIVRKIPAGGGRDRSTSGTTTNSTSNLGSTSFKENQTQQSTSRANVARSAILVKAIMSEQSNQQQQPVQRSNSSRSSSSTRALNGFMRPTASSATKRNK